MLFDSEAQLKMFTSISEFHDITTEISMVLDVGVERSMVLHHRVEMLIDKKAVLLAGHADDSDLKRY